MYLEGSLGMPVVDQDIMDYRGTNEGGAMKAITHWTSPNTGATNSSGFTAFPGGSRDVSGSYDFIGDLGIWWSSTNEIDFSLFRALLNNRSTVYRYASLKLYGFSVRCVRD
jgi:uncharacterized protein (TIGR02145 family)